MTENEISKIVFEAGLKVHKQLGPGLLESVDEKCFCYELANRNIPFVRQQSVEIIYNDFLVDDGLRIDILVDDLVILELKAQENYHPVWEAQFLSYLKLTKKRLGFLLNFHVPLMKSGNKKNDFINSVFALCALVPLCHCGSTIYNETRKISASLRA